MKKFFTLTVLALAAMAATAQTKQNMFPAADTDADGWLWFDTAEKIEKYVGIIDETNYNEDTFYHGSGATGMLYDQAPASAQAAGGNQPGAALLKGKLSSGVTYYAKTWVIYKDATGAEHTAYSDLLVIDKL